MKKNIFIMGDKQSGKTSFIYFNFLGKKFRDIDGDKLYLRRTRKIHLFVLENYKIRDHPGVFHDSDLSIDDLISSDGDIKMDKYDPLTEVSNNKDTTILYFIKSTNILEINEKDNSFSIINKDRYGFIDDCKKIAERNKNKFIIVLTFCDELLRKINIPPIEYENLLQNMMKFSKDIFGNDSIFSFMNQNEDELIIYNNIIP